jgi:protein SCO1/2
MLVATMTCPGSADAQRSEAAPVELDGLGIFHQGGAELPPDLPFTDSTGKPVLLGDYFQGERPVILSLVYYDCPMLCNIMLDQFVTGLEELDWTAGQEFDIVTVSIDPADNTAAAARKKAHQIENYGRPSAAAGWHFLIGEQAAIDSLAATVGFRYEFDPERGEFNHAAGLFVLTPAGLVSQTLLGLDYPAKTLRLSLVEASEGRIGNALDHALLFCFYYDSASGRYAPAAMNLMRLGGGLTLLVVILWLGKAWRRERRRQRPLAEGMVS